MEDYKNVQDAVNSVLNVQSFVKKKAPRESMKREKKRETFVRMINRLE